MRRILQVGLCICLISGGITLAACPSADLTGDCKVDFKDFAIMAAQWLDEYIPDPCGMVWVDINDPGIGGGHEGFNGKMSKYKTTNAQYCQYLNAVLADSQITVYDDVVYASDDSSYSEPYFDTYATSQDSQIDYNDVSGSFSVRTRDSNDMSNHPVVMVSWYGATAFCNYYGYRLPTEWEWQAVADFDGSYTYGCGTTIDQSKANYYDNVYANPLGLTSFPYTTPVDYYSSYGYGMNDMAGNVWGWTDSWYSGTQISRVVRGGYWDFNATICEVTYRGSVDSSFRHGGFGFRPVMDYD